MFSISKLIKLWAMSKFFTSRTSILQNLIMRLAAIAGIGIVIAVLIALCIGGGLCFGYNEMLLHGVDRYAALSIIVAIAVIILATLGLIAWLYWRRLQKVMHKMLTRQAPLAMRANDIVTAFFDGFLGE